MISVRSARKLNNYFIKAKLYPTERIVESYKCGGKPCEIYINVNETLNFNSTVTGETYIMNHRFDCDEKCLVYVLTSNNCKIQAI